MKKIIKRTFVTFFVLLVIIGCGLYLVLNTSVVSKYVIHRAIEENLKDYEIKSLAVTQKFISPNTLVFERLELVLNSKIYPGEKPYTLKVDRFAIILASLDNIDITVRRIDLESEKIKASDLSFEALAAIRQGKLSKTEGSLRLAEFEAKPFEASKIASSFQGDDKSLRFSNLRAEAYEGKLTGEISFAYQSPFLYSIALTAHDMDFHALEELNAAVFSQFEGEVGGNIRITGDQTKLKTIESDFSAPGGKARAALVAYLLQYGLPPGTQQREVLDFLLSTDGKIPAEQIRLNFKNVSPNKISGMYKLYSKELNVDLNNTFDFNLDSELVSLVQAVEQIKVGLMALINPHLKKEEL